jgi:hypothetical protein
MLELKTSLQLKRRNIMCKKLLILSLFIALLFALSAPITPAHAGSKSKKINWRVAGSIISTVSVKTDGVPSDQTLIRAKAKGAPGRADLTILGIAGDLDFSGTKGCDIYIPYEQNEFVAIFNDLSMLFAKIDENGDSYLCVDYSVGTTFKVDMEITGGTGRFNGATGYFTATGVGLGQYFEGPLSAETAKFKGRIDFSD